MRFSLDLVFLDERDAPLAVRCDVPAWRFVTCRGAAAVLELPSAGRTAAEGENLSPLSP
jgi:hypothetical protein